MAQGVIDIDFYYPESPGDPTTGGFAPILRNVVVEHVASERSKYALYLRGYPNDPISGVRVVQCAFNHVALPDVVQNVTGLKLEEVMRNGQPMKLE